MKKRPVSHASWQSAALANSASHRAPLGMCFAPAFWQPIPSLRGENIWSLTASYEPTQWTETRTVSTQGQEGVHKQIADIEDKLLFAILGFDTDNGGEFLHWHLVNYFQKREKPVDFTRSRKNDNARVKQKNRTHVRHLIGYGRSKKEEAAKALPTSPNFPLPQTRKHLFGYLSTHRHSFFCQCQHF